MLQIRNLVFNYCRSRSFGLLCNCLKGGSGTCAGATGPGRYQPQLNLPYLRYSVNFNMYSTYRTRSKQRFQKFLRGTYLAYLYMQCCGSETKVSDPFPDPDPAGSKFRIRIRIQIRNRIRIRIPNSNPNTD